MMTTQRPDDALSFHLMILVKGPTIPCRVIVILTQCSNAPESSPSHVSVTVLTLDRYGMLRLCYGNVKVL